MKPSEMTDEQLVRAVAEEVMDKDLQQSTWWISCKSGSYQDSFIPWNPLTDANHRDMVVEAMVKDGWDFTLEIFCIRPQMAHAHFFKMGQYEMEIEGQAAGMKGRAVCEAALMAKKGGDAP